MNDVLQKLWYDRTIRTQLMIVIGLINLCAVLIGGVISIVDAREATRVEVASSFELAKRYVQVTIEALTSDGKVTNLASKINQLSSRLQVAHLRHVRIFIGTANGNLVQLSPRQRGAANSLPPAPAWFSALIAPKGTATQLSVVLASGAGSMLIVEQPVDSIAKIWDLGAVVIVGEPADEIAEVWRDLSSLALVWLGLNLFILVALYLVLSRMLDPLATLARGLLKLESGDYATRLTPPRVAELGAITLHFNTLAEALARARTENARLYGQLITVQEEERREIANELHDEASPCLFGITANALSIERLIEKRRDRRTAEVRAHVAEILKVTDRLKLTNRLLLKKLRPVALGRVALAALIEDLLGELQRRFPDVKITHSIKTGGASYGEAIDLTIYRAVQEGLTNAIRHGKADAVTVELFEKRRAHDGNGTLPTLQLIIQDDGGGILPETRLGFGLTVMRERVAALDGSCAIQSVPPHGATLRVIVPLKDDRATVARAKQFDRIEAH